MKLSGPGLTKITFNIRDGVGDAKTWDLLLTGLRNVVEPESLSQRSGAQQHGQLRISARCRPVPAVPVSIVHLRWISRRDPDRPRAPEQLRLSIDATPLHTGVRQTSDRHTRSPYRAKRLPRLYDKVQAQPNPRSTSWRRTPRSASGGADGLCRRWAGYTRRRNLGGGNKELEQIRAALEDTHSVEASNTRFWRSSIRRPKPEQS
ncbi:hypothetical protein ABH922_001333 [Rhodococcus sp. 27YEA15]